MLRIVASCEQTHLDSGVPYLDLIVTTCSRICLPRTGQSFDRPGLHRIVHRIIPRVSRFLQDPFGVSCFPVRARRWSSSQVTPPNHSAFAGRLHCLNCLHLPNAILSSPPFKNRGSRLISCIRNISHTGSFSSLSHTQLNMFRPPFFVLPVGTDSIGSQTCSATKT